MSTVKVEELTYPERVALWGEDGWKWERLASDMIFSRLPESEHHVDVERHYMGLDAECGGDSPQGGLAKKLEVWRNRHWFVHLYRDEIVLCRSAFNMGDDPDYDWPKMIWLSMRRTFREEASSRDWREMQRVKNDLVGPEHEGVELYPAEHRLVDTCEQFHIWCFEDAQMSWPFGYIERDVAADTEQKECSDG